MNLLLRNPDLPTGKLLHTFECEFHYNLVIWPGNLLFDEKGWGIDISDQRWEIYHRAHNKRDAEWSMVFEPHKLRCRICHSDELIISFETGILYDPLCGFFAEALACMGMFYPARSQVTKLLHDFTMDKSRKKELAKQFGPSSTPRFE
jgi:hypothetical protein